jgi:hypothetical protein
MSDAISSRAIPLLPASCESQQRNCASAGAASVRIIGHLPHARGVTYSLDFASSFDHVPIVGAPTAQFSRGPLFASNLIFLNNT